MLSLLSHVMVDWPHMTAQAVQQQAQVADPVIIHENGRAVAASTQLSDWQPDMPLMRARRLYMEATFLPRDRACEQAAHTRLAHQLTNFSPRIAALRPGCFLIQDPDIDDLARFICDRPHLRAGAAAAREWAHLALCMAPVGTLRLVCDSDAFLNETPVDVLAGPLGEAGPDVASRLHLFGLHNLGEVQRRLSRKHLCNQFGSELGGGIDRLVRPGAQPAVPCYTFPKTVHTTHEFETPSALAEPWIRHVVRHMAERLAHTLEGRAALTLTLQAFIPGQGVVDGRHLSRRGLYSVSDLCRLAMNLYEQLSTRLAAADVLSLRLVAGMLITRAHAQGRLFTSRLETPALKRAVALLQKRYGPQTLLHMQRKASLFVEDRLAVVPMGQV